MEKQILGRDIVAGQWISYLLSMGGNSYRWHEQDILQNIIWKDFSSKFLQEAKNAGVYTGDVITSQKGDVTVENSEYYKEIEAFRAYKQAYQPPSVVSTTKSFALEGNYYYVGPVRISYTEKDYNGKLFGGPETSTIKVYDSQGAEMSSNYWKIVDSAYNELDYIHSNQDCYIRINENAFTSGGYAFGISKMTLSIRDLNATSKFYIVGNDDQPTWQQWLLLESAETSWDTESLNISINAVPKEEGGLRLIKQDTDTKEPIQGVGFKIYSRDKGQYITGTNPVKYGNESSARVFYTDANGIIQVQGLPTGSYQAIETTIGDNYGYVVDSTPHSFTVK